MDAKRLSDQALSFISSLDFPGNVRQLENLCNWITVMAPGQVVEVADLPSELVQGSNFSAMLQNGQTNTEQMPRISLDGLSWSDLLEVKASELLQKDVPEIE